jgi:hypothetical protein
MMLADTLPAMLMAGAAFAGYSALRQRLRALEHRVSVFLTQVQLDPAAHISARVVALAQDPAQYRAAIRAYRAETGLGQQAATEAVQALVDYSRQR